MTTAVSIVAYGSPAPQGSKRHVGRGVMVESSKAVKPWREAVKAAAIGVMTQTPALFTPPDPTGPCVEYSDGSTTVLAPGLIHIAPFDGPLRVRMVFTVRKPASAPKRRRTWPDRTPDLSKLIRATEDALTEAGVWADDARVVEYDRAAKVFPGEDPEALHIPGVRIEVRPVVEAAVTVELVG